MSVGKRLKEERERLALAQPVIAEYAGTTKQTQYSYETDKSPIKSDYLAKVAELGVDVAYVITGVRSENVAHTVTELAYLRHCRLFATKGLSQSGLDVLTAVRQSHGLEWTDLPTIEGENDV